MDNIDKRTIRENNEAKANYIIAMIAKSAGVKADILPDVKISKVTEYELSILTLASPFLLNIAIEKADVNNYVKIGSIVEQLISKAKTNIAVTPKGDRLTLEMEDRKVKRPTEFILEKLANLDLSKLETVLSKLATENAPDLEIPDEIKKSINDNINRSGKVVINKEPGPRIFNEEKASPINNKEVEDMIQVLIRGEKSAIGEWNLWRMNNPYAKINVEGYNFAGIDFRGERASANLSGLYAKGANFSGANLDGAYARGMHTEGAIFDGASMNNMDITMIIMDKTTSLKNIGVDKINVKTLNTSPDRVLKIPRDPEEKKAEDEKVYFKGTFKKQNPGVAEEIEATEVARLQQGIS